MFKNLSNRVSAKTIEETYTENDVAHVLDPVTHKETTDISANYVPSTGFTFDYPMRWLNEETDFKAIGIRRLKVVPTSHVFALNVSIEYMLDGGGEAKHTVTDLVYHASITSENTLEDIVYDMLTKLNERLQHIALEYNGSGGDDPEPMSEAMCFTYTFDYKTGDFALKLTPTGIHEMALLKFLIKGDHHDNTAENNIDFFLKFLNQERSDENRNKLIHFSESKHFTDVWDRSSLQFHASFSNNRRNFIGLNGDFYDAPSVFYDPPTNASDFWIKFTTDGRHQFLPRYCRFYIGLSFVRNYKNSLVTK